MQSEVFDLAIIGGGINGAAIAKDAALRGMKVILFEKHDFGFGASSKTSKLAHGGLRYLEQWQFSLVKETMQERALLLKQVPHLVRPICFILPHFTSDPHKAWEIQAGLMLYDFLGRHDTMPKHQVLSKETVLALLPGIKENGLTKGFCFFDGRMNDIRLLMETVLAAEEAGAIMLNYAPVTSLSFEKEKINGVYALLPGTQAPQKIYAKQVVNATGAWSNQIAQMDPSIKLALVTPTKGCHLVLQKWIDKPILLRAPQDQRVFFIIPWGEGDLTLVGTTDTFFEAEPEKAYVEAVDKEYLLEAVNYYFPHLHASENSIISSFVGLRPLAASHITSHPTSASRQQELHLSASGLISIFGGKYTSFRKIAQEVVDLAVKRSEKRFLDCKTDKISFSDDIQLYAIEFLQAGLTQKQVQHMLSNYGRRCLHILELIKEDKSLSEPLCEFHSHLKAEYIYALQKEHVKTEEDWIFRRSNIAYFPCRGECCHKFLTG